ncbi:MAG: hypothetical protein M3176_10780 [Chloroflexota bacterium]|nr:hypothetical protein [Chloroflexota bacterium]
MSKNDFADLFRSALASAVRNTEQRLGKRLPGTLLIDMHTPRPPFDPMDVDTALDRLWVEEDRFRWVIDVAVVAYSVNSTFLFVRPSDHHSVPLERTMMYPDREAPFQQMIAATVPFIVDESRP